MRAILANWRLLLFPAVGAFLVYFGARLGLEKQMPPDPQPAGTITLATDKSVPAEVWVYVRRCHSHEQYCHEALSIDVEFKQDPGESINWGLLLTGGARLKGIQSSWKPFGEIGDYTLKSQNIWVERPGPPFSDIGPGWAQLITGTSRGSEWQQDMSTRDGAMSYLAYNNGGPWTGSGLNNPVGGPIDSLDSDNATRSVRLPEVDVVDSDSYENFPERMRGNPEERVREIAGVNLAAVRVESDSPPADDMGPNGMAWNLQHLDFTFHPSLVVTDLNDESRHSRNEFVAGLLLAIGASSLIAAVQERVSIIGRARRVRIADNGIQQPGRARRRARGYALVRSGRYAAFLHSQRRRRLKATRGYETPISYRSRKPR
jgi:hypothetical protein